MTTPPPDLPAPRPRGRPPKIKLPPSANALRHGVLSTSPVIPTIESETGWQAHLAGQVAALNPQGDLELALAHRVAFTLWRLNRLIAFERHALAPSDLYLEKLDEMIEARRSRLGDDTDTLPEYGFPAYHMAEVQRYEAHLHRIVLKDLHELEALQTRRRGDPTPLARVEVN